MDIKKIAVTLFFIQTVFEVHCSLSDVTSEVFSNAHTTGILAAFGDLNADKATDIFVLSENGTYSSSRSLETRV